MLTEMNFKGTTVQGQGTKSAQVRITRKMDILYREGERRKKQPRLGIYERVKEHGGQKYEPEKYFEWLGKLPEFSSRPSWGGYTQVEEWASY